MAMENVSYFLGAGFSAPLGLPLSSNFIEKSKDLYANNPGGLAHFSLIYRTLDEISKIKNYFHADLFNIEEALSILEMSTSLAGTSDVKRFKTFIFDVIKKYTPEIDARNPGFHINDLLLSYESKKYPYAIFLLAACNLLVENDHVTKEDNLIHFGYWKESFDYRYSFVTLNYDIVIEKLINYINMHIHVDPAIEIAKKQGVNSDFRLFRLAKLHGSVDAGDIILPTWNKVMAKQLNSWKLAFEILQNANHIRLIGYSLPETDAYVKYLLKSAVLSSSNLKSIDVICLDPQGEIKRRYEDFINFPKMRFINGDVEDYLEAIRDAAKDNRKRTRLDFSVIEKAHSSFVDEYYG